jgi:hypothetical protein
MCFMSRTMMWRFWARRARGVMNQIRERMEPMPWIMTRGASGEEGGVGLWYQYPNPLFG